MFVQSTAAYKTWNRAIFFVAVAPQLDQTLKNAFHPKMDRSRSRLIPGFDAHKPIFWNPPSLNLRQGD